jgi:hypothetical protein
MSVCPFVVTALFSIILKYFEIAKFWQLILVIGLYTLLYVLLFCIFSMNKFERTLFFTPLKGLGNMLK